MKSIQHHLDRDSAECTSVAVVAGSTDDEGDIDEKKGLLQSEMGSPNLRDRPESIHSRRKLPLTTLQAVDVDVDTTGTGTPKMHNAAAVGVGDASSSSRASDVNGIGMDTADGNGDHSDVIEPDQLNLHGNFAFVTFNSAAAAALSVRKTKTKGKAKANTRSHDLKLNVVSARQPRDVRWSDLLRQTAKGEPFVNATVVALATALMLVWGFATFVVGLYTSPEQLDCLLANCSSSGVSEFGTFLLGFVSPLSLQVLSALGSQFMSSIVGLLYVPFASQTDQFMLVFSWTFQMLQNFLIYSIANTLVVDIVEYVEDPRSLLKVLGTNLPSGASFYMIFIETEVAITLMLLLFRWAWLSGSWLHIGCCCTIPLRRSVYSPAFCSSYGVPTTPSTLAPASSLARVLLVCVIANSFAVIQPLISIVAVIYGIAAFTVHTHQLLAVEVVRFDSGGLYWRDVYGILAACVVIPEFVLLTLVVTASRPWLVGIQIFVLVATCTAFLLLWFCCQSKALHVPEGLLQRVDSTAPHAGGSASNERFSTLYAKEFGTGINTASANANGEANVNDGCLRNLQHCCKDQCNATAGLNNIVASPLSEELTPHPAEATTTTTTTSTVIALPAHTWRSVAVECGDALGERSYLVPAVAEDVAYANTVGLRQGTHSDDTGTGMHNNKSVPVPVGRTSIFVYDYYHPSLRAARTMTSRFTASRRKQDQEQAAAMLVQSVARMKLARRAMGKIKTGTDRGDI